MESSSTKVPGDRTLTCGVLNLLGEAFNPFEFLPTKDAAFMQSYAALRGEWESLQWGDVERCALLLERHGSSGLAAALADLRASCEANQGLVAPYFNEEVLKNDNKHLANRINLITMAMSTVSRDSTATQSCLVSSDAWDRACLDHPDLTEKGGTAVGGTAVGQAASDASELGEGPWLARIASQVAAANMRSTEVASEQGGPSGQPKRASLKMLSKVDPPFHPNFNASSHRFPSAPSIAFFHFFLSFLFLFICSSKGPG